MITEDYVSFETAKLLKEKGFNEKLLTFYITDEAEKESDFQTMYFTDDKIDNNQSPHCYLAPTLQMTMKWLREKHLLHIPIDMMNGGRWKYEIDDISIPVDGGVLPKYYCDKTFSSYEEAVDDAIKYCLENLI